MSWNSSSTWVKNRSENGQLKTFIPVAISQPPSPKYLAHGIIVTIWTDLIVWDRLGCWQKKGVRIESELLWTPLAPLPGAGASYLRDNLWDWKIKEGHDQHVLLLTAYGSHQVALSHANHQVGGEGADVRYWELIMKISGRITSKLLKYP